MNDANEIDTIINESGNNFHCKVTNYLIEKGWHTLVSPYYMDGGTGKAREIDLIAEKSWLYKDEWSKTYGTVNIKLFIECKYIPQNNVFWFSDKDMISAKDWVTSNTPLRDNNMFTDRHHYLSTNPKVAKLFASKNRPNVENEVIYKALNQSLNSMVYLRNQASIIPENSNRNVDILSTIELPVILCNNFEKFHRVEMEDSSDPVRITDNFQLEVNYAYIESRGDHRSEYFILDIVDFNNLDDFLSVLESDKDAIFQIL